MGKYTVVRYGTDSSGRPIYMTRFMHAWLEAVKDDHRVRSFADLITVVQGAFMTRAGGGATASAGYHDKAGCVDFRTWNLTTDQLDTFVVVGRLKGGAAWRRDYASVHGGMDPHCHVTVGRDRVMTSGAKASWSGYLRGTNGLANGWSDYEWRPSPLRYFKWKKKAKRKKVNLTHLIDSWSREGGKTYNPWGKKACRTLHKALLKKKLGTKKYRWNQGWFGAQLRDEVRRANRHYGITEYTGEHNDRPTWELCRKLGLAPYKTEKQRHPRKQRVKTVRHDHNHATSK